MAHGKWSGNKLHKDFLNNRGKLVNNVKLPCAILHALYDLTKYEGMQKGSRQNKGVIRWLFDPKYLSLVQVLTTVHYRVQCKYIQYIKKKHNN